MALNKVNYIDNQTVITAANLNEIQDAVIKNESEISKKANASSIPTKLSDLTNDSNFLTSIPSEYVVEDQLNEVIDLVNEIEDTTALLAEDVKILKENASTGSGSQLSSWNDLQDKPFYPPTVYYEWSEDVVYDTIVSLPEGAGAAYLAKISEEAPMPNDLIGKYVHIEAMVNGDKQEIDQAIQSNMIQVYNDDVYLLGNMFYIILVESTDIEGIVLTKGIWSMDGWDNTKPVVYIKVQIFEPGKDIDESVIPDTIARVEDIEHYTYGTDDLIAGESTLTTGKLYFVYE